MVVNLGLSAEQFAAYEQTITGPHQVRAVVLIEDLDGNLIQDVSDMGPTGQVNIAAGGETSRSCMLTLFDPTYRVGLDEANPEAGPVSPRYQVRLARSVHVPTVGWVDVPLGVLPFTFPQRDGDTLMIEAQGKESLAQANTWTPLVIKKGTDKVTAIRTIMATLTGETLFRIEPTTALLDADLSIGRDTSPWQACRDLAESMGRRLFYAADGYLVCRTPSTSPVFEFRTGIGGTLLSRPRAGFSSDSVANLVYVTGAVPKGKNDPISAFAVAPASHPLSPQNLGRNGVPRYLRHDVSDDTLATVAACQALADQSLTQVLLNSVDIQFDSLPVAHLEEGDAIRVTDSLVGISMTGTVTSQSIPLTTEGSQSNGYLRRVQARSVLHGRAA